MSDNLALFVSIDHSTGERTGVKNVTANLKNIKQLCF